MPNRGPVYQPTTESYGHQGEWRSPSGLLSQTTTTVGKDRCLLWVTLGLGILAVVSGFILIIAGGATFANADSDDLTPVIILIIGSLLTIIGIVIFAISRYGLCRPNCFRFLLKEKRIAHQMRDTQSVNGQAMNPSTDFLVSAQYAPISEVAYQPPAVSEEEETRKLMGSDNKDCNEESERILDKDPRIVLRPLSKVEEFQDAEVQFLFLTCSILKETDSIITLNPDRFESESTPESRKLSNRLNYSKTAADKMTSETTGKATGGSKCTWKDTIIRKASVRSKRAPLADSEDITPSLRSSWSSMYFNQTPTNSESDRYSYASEML